MSISSPLHFRPRNRQRTRSSHIDRLLQKLLYLPSTYRMFQKQLHNFEGLYTFTQRTCTVFRTVKTHRVLPRIATVQYDFHC
jgi:hypothetical protein